MPELLDRLYQGEEWISNDGKRWNLERMSVSHRRNVMLWLRNNAERLKGLTEETMAFSAAPSGEAAREAFEADFDALLHSEADVWIMDTPLYRALENLDRATR